MNILCDSMGVIVMCFILALSIGSIDGHEIIKRRTGQQAPSGKCALFNWGGTTRVHYYICCNNCQDTDNSCDGRTYHTASTGSYCSSCGKDNSNGNGQLKSQFYCGGCEGQKAIYNKCYNYFRDIPGFCWSFANCFKEQCSNHRQIRSAALSHTCFDGICQAGESTTNCPIDCCATKSAKCVRKKGQCPPQCCGTPTCCITSSNSGYSMRKNSLDVLKFFILPFSMQFLILN